MDGIDPDFTNALCPNDLDRCLDNMERVFKRLPCLESTGIHTVINGPITYSADGLPLVGKLPHVNNAYCIVGLRAGVGEGGGHGKILAEIIVHGESEWDTWCLDPRRFSPWVNTEYTALKAIEDYQNEFRFHMPHEHRPAGRPARTTPLYSRNRCVQRRQRVGTRQFLQAERGFRRGTQLSFQQLARRRRSRGPGGPKRRWHHGGQRL